MHVRVDKSNGLVCSKVILDGLSHFFHLTFYSVDLLINFFKLRTEIWVDDVVVLLGLTDVDAFLKHSFKLRKLLERSVEGLNNLSPQRMVFLSHVFVEIANEALQCVNHIVDLYTFDKLRIVAQFSLDTVELCI